MNGPHKLWCNPLSHGILTEWIIKGALVGSRLLGNALHGHIFVWSPVPRHPVHHEVSRFALPRFPPYFASPCRDPAATESHDHALQPLNTEAHIVFLPLSHFAQILWRSNRKWWIQTWQKYDNNENHGINNFYRSIRITEWTKVLLQHFEGKEQILR